jgi:hypothetical protein
MDSVPYVWKAYLQPLPDGDLIWVHFNPASLVYTVENSGRQQAKDPARRQYAGQFTGKLTMDLQFDTTDSGDDVRDTTNKIARFMQSSAQANQAGKGAGSGANAPAQPVLLFQWGLYAFKGYMESFRETIDFFSADGVPLRALVSIGLARQDKVFDEDQQLIGTGTGAGSVIKTSSSDSATKVTTKMGNPKASRALAASNGLENPRFTAGASLQVSAGIQLNAAAGFAASASAGGGSGLSAGLSGGVPASAGISAGAGASFGSPAGASAGASVSGGASATAGLSLSGGGGALFGGTASAGVPATAGAFAGLETGRAVVSTTANLDPLKMMPATVASDVSVGANASFSLGGAASSQSSFSANVGAGFSFNDRLVFDSD